MIPKYSIRTIFSLGLISLTAFALPQQPAAALPSDGTGGAQARGAFITSRKKTSDAAQNQPTPTPRPQASHIANKSAPKARKKAPPTTPAPAETVIAAETTAIGLGYTLYQRNADGDAVRVGPHTSFRNGDAVRFVVEPNTDGYLYIFHSENGGEPQMIFPDHRLNEGANQIKAHVPYEVPSRKAEIKWFTFDEKPAVEKLFIVVARKPLPDVPTGQALLGYCKTVGEDCTWKPARKHFDPVLAYAKEPKVTSLGLTKGEVQAEIERDAITRGLGLSAKAPEPTLVQINASAKAEVMVMTAELNHRQ